MKTKPARTMDGERSWQTTENTPALLPRRSSERISLEFPGFCQLLWERPFSRKVVPRVEDKSLFIINDNQYYKYSEYEYFRYYCCYYLSYSTIIIAIIITFTIIKIIIMIIMINIFALTIFVVLIIVTTLFLLMSSLLLHLGIQDCTASHTLQS